MTPTPAHIEQARQMWEVATPQERVWLVQMWEEERAAQFTALVDTIAEDGEGAFGAFIRWAWPIVEPGGALVWEWPQELMASYLHRLMRFEITRLVICVPPRIGQVAPLLGHVPRLRLATPAMDPSALHVDVGEGEPAGRHALSRHREPPRLCPARSGGR